jgi:hypothetical protein
MMITANTNLVTLQTFCAGLGIVPREARVKLRALAKAKQLPTTHAVAGRGRKPKSPR